MKDHNLKETFLNIVLGFEFDLRKHIEVLEAMGEDVHKIKCGQCEYKTCIYAFVVFNVFLLGINIYM